MQRRLAVRARRRSAAVRSAVNVSDSCMGEKDHSDKQLAGDGGAVVRAARRDSRACAPRRRDPLARAAAARRHLPPQHALHDHARRLRPHRIELQLDRSDHVAVDRGARRPQQRRARRRHLLLVEGPRRAGALLAAHRAREARLRSAAPAAPARRPARASRTSRHAVHRHQHRLARHGHLQGVRHGARAAASPAAAAASS